MHRVGVLMMSGAAFVLVVSACSGSGSSPVATAVVAHVRGLPPGVSEPPPRLQAQMEEMDKLSVGTPEYFDLKDPWLTSPK